MATTKSIRGVYRQGRVELCVPTELPEGTEVTVAVPVRADDPVSRAVSFGMFAGPPFSDEDNFREAEFQDDRHEGSDR